MNPTSQKWGKLNPYLLLCPPRPPKLPSAPPSLQLCDIKAAPSSPHHCLHLGFSQILPVRRFQLQQRRGIREIIIFPVKEGNSSVPAPAPNYLQLNTRPALPGLGCSGGDARAGEGGTFSTSTPLTFPKVFIVSPLCPKPWFAAFQGSLSVKCSVVRLQKKGGWVDKDILIFYQWFSGQLLAF